MTEQETAMEEGPKLLPHDKYMECGVHVGTQQKSKVMERFIYRVRNDGLYVLDVGITDQRIADAADFLARYDPEEILFVSARQYGHRPIRTLAKYLGCQGHPGRFMPGTLTNPRTAQYIEPSVVVVNDPLSDAQVLRESVSAGIPVVALVDTNNELKYVDVAIPTNNKGRRSLALVYWLLTRELAKRWGKISSDDDFDLELEDFEETW